MIIPSVTYTTKEIAELMNISNTEAQELISSGRIKSQAARGEFFVKGKDVIAFLNQEIKEGGIS